MIPFYGKTYRFSSFYALKLYCNKNIFASGVKPSQKSADKGVHISWEWVL